MWPDDGINSRVSSRNSEVRTDNWELNQIANVSGGGSRVEDESLNENREVAEDLAERESQRLAERENEENEVRILEVNQKFIADRETPTRCISCCLAMSRARVRAPQCLLR